MEWVAPFYRQQFELLTAYSRSPVAAAHTAIAERVPALATPPPGRVLELGAGGGQVAAATAALGYIVTAVDLVPAATAHTTALAVTLPPGALTAVNGDFYTVALPGPFDVVTYWDGFGIGVDADQRRLLTRIHSWLTPGGTALLDVYTPWFWAARAGTTMHVETMGREYGFDADGCRMLDRCWPLADPAASLTQSLRCYTPADLRLLLAGTGLTLRQVVPGGGFDRATGDWRDTLPLGAAMSYVAVLQPEIGSRSPR